MTVLLVRERRFENHSTRRGPGSEVWTTPPELFGFSEPSMYPICQAHPYATSIILVAVSPKDSVSSNGL